MNAAESTSVRPRRYPGLKPFVRAQSAVFHGRSEDTQVLTDLVMRERLVVLFSKSGIGKTSLLQAGVAPKLEKEEYVPIFLRCDNVNAPLVQTLSEVLQKDAHVSGRDTTGARLEQPVTLWELLKRLEFEHRGFPAVPVLVFDQFEEVFTLAHPEASKQDFLAQLADVANNVMPEALRAELLTRFDDKEAGLTMELMNWWEKQPDVRLVLSIRSDFLHMLDQISPMIPGILRNRYQLLPLNHDKAAEAITVPAQAPGQWASEPFVYEPTALQEMIDYLAGYREESRSTSQGVESTVGFKKRDEIESFNLQIVCQDIEEKIIDTTAEKGFGGTVTSDFYERREGLERSIRNFYKNQLETFPKAYKERLQNRPTISPADVALLEQSTEELRSTAARLIEDQLVTPGNRRNSVVDDVLVDTYHISPDFLDTLVDKSRLLRKEPRLDDFYYEISHDTLLPAIIEARNQRRRREQADQERAALEAQTAAERAELERQIAQQRADQDRMAAELKALHDRRRIQQRLIGLMVFTAFVMFAFALWLVYNWVRSATKEMQLADFIVSTEAYDAGIEAYQDLWNKPFKSALLQRMTGRNVAQELQKVQNMKQLHDAIVYANMRVGDSLFFADKYAHALSRYRCAYDLTDLYNQANDYVAANYRDTTWRIEPMHVREKFNTLWQRRDFTLQTLISQFQLYQRDAETFQEARVWPQVLRNLRAMEELVPEHPNDAEALRVALKLGNEDPHQYVARQIAFCRKEMGR